VAEPALQTEGLGKRYGKRKWALRHVDLSLLRGSMTALVGPNGAGKSTLLRSWMGFEQPTEGRVEVLGIDVHRDPKSALAHLGYVSQTPTLYAALQVADHLRLAAQVRPGFAIDEAASRVERLGIDLKATGAALSGGQQAQVVLSIALATRAEVLLLDEPLASLDPLARREFLLVVSGAVKAGTTAVMSSHIVTDIEQMCDHLIVLGDGGVLLHASVADALAGHSISSGGDGLGRIGSFAGAAGEPMTLIGHDPAARPPGSRSSTLEEIVIGHLASIRSTPGPGAAA
jgi:ABC-2 type transport system ATP-binding protein